MPEAISSWLAGTETIETKEASAPGLGWCLPFRPLGAWHRFDQPWASHPRGALAPIGVLEYGRFARLRLLDPCSRRYGVPVVIVRQAWCLTLATNAVVAWTTEYYGLAIEQMRRAGRRVDDEARPTSHPPTARTSTSSVRSRPTSTPNSPNSDPLAIDRCGFATTSSDRQRSQRPVSDGAGGG